ncbi:MAG: tetratricopeptide repeat protein [Propionibacteriaceae bacterium]
MDTQTLSYSIGRAHVENGRYREAVDHLRDLVVEVPDHSDARLLLARAYYHSALLAPAEEHLAVLLERDPTDDYARLLLVRTLERQSRHEEAGTQRRILAALTGDDSHLRTHRAFT